MSTEDQEEKKVYIQDWDELPYFEKEQNLTLKNKFKEINVSHQNFRLVDAMAGSKHLLFACNTPEEGGKIYVYDEKYKEITTEKKNSEKEEKPLFQEIKRARFVNDILVVVGVTQDYKGVLSTKSYVKQIYIKITDMKKKDNFEEKVKKLDNQYPLFNSTFYSTYKEKSIQEKTEVDVNDIEITSMDISPNKNCIAIALSSRSRDPDIDSKILVLQGDIVNSVPKYYYTPIGGKITGLRFIKKKPGSWSGDAVSLFVSTDNSVIKFENPESMMKEVTWDQVGTETGVTIEVKESEEKSILQRAVVATKNELIFYSPETENQGKGQSFPCPNAKLLIKGLHLFQPYLFIVHKEYTTRVKGYHIDHHISALSYLVDSDKQVKALIQEFNMLFIILEHTTNHSITVVQFEEKSNRKKIDILVQNSKFQVAEALAYKGNFSIDVKADIAKKFGDYEFINKKWNEAIKHYKNTIGNIEPSYIIRKFLKEHQNKHLIDYLVALHQRKYHNPDHTVLLIKCITKEPNIKEEVERDLDKFIHDFSKDIDPDLSIRTLIEFGYLKHALTLAREVQAHDWFIKINLQYLPDDGITSPYLVALQYLESLDFEYTSEFMRVYSSQFIEKIPKQTVNLLIRLCVAYYPISEKYTGSRKIDKDSNLNHEKTKHISRKKVTKQIVKVGVFGTEYKEGVEEIETFSDEGYVPKYSYPKAYIESLMKKPYWLMVFLENVIERIHQTSFKTLHEKDSPLISPMCYNTLLELYLYFWENSDKIQAPTSLYPYRQYQFLNDKKVKPLDEEIDSLYDIYPPNETLFKKTYEEKIMYLLKFEGAKYVYIKGETKERSRDKNDEYPMLLQALILCQSKFFEKGILFIYEKMGLYYDILKYHMSRYDLTSLKESLTHLFQENNPFNTTSSTGANKDSFMYSYVLNYLVDLKIPKKDLDDDIDLPPENEIDDKIKTIIQEAENLLNPLEILSVLNPLGESTSQNAIRFDLVQDYLLRKVNNQMKKIQENNEYIKKYHVETSKIRSEIEENLTTATTFNSQKCASPKCGLALDLPIVHFMCKHSYHQRCLSERECPKCFERDLKQRRKYTELFKKESKSWEELEKKVKNPGHQGIVDFYGKGLFLTRKIKHDMFYDSFEPVIDEHEEEYERRRENFEN